MFECSLGIDIGGTKIAAGLVTKNGELIQQKTYQTPIDSKDHILELLRDIIVQFTKQAKEMQYILKGIGIGSAGQVHYEKGIILSGTANLPDWNNVPIVDYLKESTNLPIWLDNDANTFVIAEYLFGIVKGTDNIIGLTLGTGVGGGVITNGSMVRGNWGGAAELGHITINMHGPRCNCGSKGCLETYASGTGIANRMKEKIDWLAEGRLTEELQYYKEHSDELTSKEVFSWYESKLPIATEVINEAVEALSYGIVSLIHTFNPSVITLGGGLVKNRAWLAERLQENIQDRGMSSLVQPVQIYISDIGEDAGLIGAASQVWFQK